jgi:hypothetical protein
MTLTFCNAFPNSEVVFSFNSTGELPSVSYKSCSRFFVPEARPGAIALKGVARYQSRTFNGTYAFQHITSAASVPEVLNIITAAMSPSSGAPGATAFVNSNSFTWSNNPSSLRPGVVTVLVNNYAFGTSLAAQVAPVDCPDVWDFTGQIAFNGVSTIAVLPAFYGAMVSMTPAPGLPVLVRALDTSHNYTAMAQPWRLPAQVDSSLFLAFYSGIYGSSTAPVELWFWSSTTETFAPTEAPTQTPTDEPTAAPTGKPGSTYAAPPARIWPRCARARAHLHNAHCAACETFKCASDAPAGWSTITRLAPSSIRCLASVCTPSAW